MKLNSSEEIDNSGDFSKQEQKWKHYSAPGNVAMQEYKPSAARSSILSREFDNEDFYVKCLILNVVDKVSFCF